jgi:hypothetical protein
LKNGPTRSGGGICRINQHALVNVDAPVDGTSALLLISSMDAGNLFVSGKDHVIFVAVGAMTLAE